MDSRERLPNEPPLLDPERAIRLAEEATAFFRAPGDGLHELTRLAVKTAMDAAHLALETAIDTGDPRVLAAALELASRRARGWGEEHFEVEIALAATEIFPAVTEINNRVRECARSPSSFLRQLTAKGLGPRALRSLRGESDEAEAEVDAEAAGIVFALTKDKDADVRAAAREALGGAAPPAWATFFPRDPLATRPAAEAARLRGPLDRAAEALEEGVRKDAAPLAEAIAELPDELAMPILDAWIQTSRALHAENVEPLLERCIAVDPDGERTALWIRKRRNDDDFESGAIFGKALKRRPGEEARAIALRVARLLNELPHDLSTRLENAEELVEHGWPDGADPRPLLELVLGAPLAEAAALPDEEDASRPRSNTLVKLALRPATLDVLIEPLVEAFLTGMPGRWARVRNEVEERLVDIAHPRLRAHTEALLREGEGAALTWALRHLTRGGHDPSVDPAIERFLEGAVRDPRLRAAMLRDGRLRAPAQQVLRAQLAAGELPMDEVVSVASSFHDPSDDAALSPDEWAQVRRARLTIEDPTRRAAAVALLPSFERWTADDHTFVDSLIDNHGDDETVAIRISVTLMPRLHGTPARPELVPLFERLLARASDEGADFVLSTLKACRGEDPYS